MGEKQVPSENMLKYESYKEQHERLKKAKIDKIEAIASTFYFGYPKKYDFFIEYIHGSTEKI